MKRPEWRLPVVMMICALVSGAAAQAATGTAEAGVSRLPPNVEAFFPKDDPLDPKIWDYLNVSGLALLKGHSRQRHLLKARRGVNPFFDFTVCQDYVKNRNLYGGALDGSCELQPISPRLKHGNRFSAVDWQPLPPEDHLSLIRDLFIAKQPSAPRIFRDPAIKDSYWFKMAPAIKRFLERKAVRLWRARIDVDGNGTTETVYALSLLPRNACLIEGGGTGARKLYLYIADDVPIRDSFNNANTWGGQPFFYEGRLYFASPISIEKGLSHPDSLSRPPRLIYDLGEGCAIDRN